MPEQDPLAQLRDLHLPADISAWPPAPGWWLLALLLISLLAIALFQLVKIIRRNRYRRQALQQLLQLSYSSTEPAAYLQQLNRLLKRTALAASPAQNVASLNGEAWLAFLDRSLQSNEFCNGPGQVLAHGPYSPTPTNIDPQALQQLCQRWIKHHKIDRGAEAQC